MAYQYTTALIDGSLTYPDYKNLLNDTVASAPVDAMAEKMRPHIINNIALMDEYDHNYRVSSDLAEIIAAAPSATWLVITEGWCGDAAFNVPMFNTIAQLMPEKVQLRLALRDSNLELIDANLTDGGRSIPKLVVLSNSLIPLGVWGPRPAGLQELMKQWKNEGLVLKDIIPKVHGWYNEDKTHSLQQELIELVKSYS